MKPTITAASSSPQDEAVDSRRPPPSEPHPALFMVMFYLDVQDLLTVRTVCRALRDAVSDDPLLWRYLVVEPPLSWRLTDDALWEVTSRADGRLRTLGLISCHNVTYYGVQRVVDANPCIVKLHLPGCTNITGECVVRMVQRLTGGKQRHLKQLRLHGISSLTKEHVNVLNTLIQNRKSMSHFDYSLYLYENNDRPIDIDVCPKCNYVDYVYDCSKEKCRLTKHRSMECRGCTSCIPRCFSCGGCLISDEDVICLDCWLSLPPRPLFTEENLQ